MGWSICRKRLDGTLTVPGCTTEGETRGGHCLGMLDPIFNLPVAVPANAAYRHHFSVSNVDKLSKMDDFCTLKEKNIIKV